MKGRGESGWRGSIALILGLFTLPAFAGPQLPWYELSRISGEVGAALARSRELACGTPRIDDLPVTVPPQSRLVFISCHGGPYDCPGRTDGQVRVEGQLTCPLHPTSREIATLHFVSTQPPEALETLYAEQLGPAFAEVASDLETQVVFIEKPSQLSRHPWSPKRLHLTVSPTKGEFRGAGYESHVRILLSLRPPHTVRYRSICSSRYFLRYYPRRWAARHGFTKPAWCGHRD